MGFGRAAAGGNGLCRSIEVSHVPIDKLLPSIQKHRPPGQGRKTSAFLAVFVWLTSNSFGLLIDLLQKNRAFAGPCFCN